MIRQLGGHRGLGRPTVLLPLLVSLLSASCANIDWQVWRYNQTARHLSPSEKRALLEGRPFIGMAKAEADLAMRCVRWVNVGTQALYAGGADRAYLLEFSGDPPRVVHFQPSRLAANGETGLACEQQIATTETTQAPSATSAVEPSQPQPQPISPTTSLVTPRASEPVASSSEGRWLRITGDYYPREIRERPDLASAILTRAWPGSRLRYLGRTDTWYEVVTEKGRGYIDEKYVEVESEDLD